MNDQELRMEAIRLVDEINEDRLEDVVACLRVFREQQDFVPHDIDTEELKRHLDESIKQAQRGELIPHEQVVKEINELLASRKAGGKR
jgi:hypothetical protein